MKKSLLAIVSIASASALLVSCSMGVVSSSKLDGSWKVTAGDITNSSSYTSGSVTTTSSSSSTYNGTELSTSNTNGNVTTTVTEMLTIDLTFDKKTNEYTRTSVSTNPEYSNYTTYYYEKVGADYVYTGSLETMIERVSTTNESGLYTITGNAGDDIEKNSQIVFQQDMYSETYSDSYMYMSGTTEVSASGKYTYEWDGSAYSYIALPTSETGTVTNNGTSTTAEIWTVTELKKGEMQVNYKNVNEYSDSSSDNSSTSSSEYNWTLTQE